MAALRETLGRGGGRGLRALPPGAGCLRLSTGAARQSWGRAARDARQIAHHVGNLGFEVTLCRRPEPGPGEADDTQAA